MRLIVRQEAHLNHIHEESGHFLSIDPVRPLVSPTRDENDHLCLSHGLYDNPYPTSNIKHICVIRLRYRDASTRLIFGALTTVSPASAPLPSRRHPPPSEYPPNPHLRCHFSELLSDLTTWSPTSPRPSHFVSTSPKYVSRGPFDPSSTAATFSHPPPHPPPHRHLSCPFPGVPRRGRQRPCEPPCPLARRPRRRVHGRRLCG